MRFVGIFVLVFFLIPLCSSSVHKYRHHFRHRRSLLHEPLFTIASPPSEKSPSQPKLPFTDNPIIANPPPFFPFTSSPPSPGTATTTTSSVPANISSLILPRSSRHHHPRFSLTLFVVISVPLISLFLLAFSIFAIRRNNLLLNTSMNDNQQLFPENTETSDGRKPSCATPSSQFLYLGTFVNSRRSNNEENSTESIISSPYQKLSSPELHQLPPLINQSDQAKNNADFSSSDNNEFYSPRASSEDEKGCHSSNQSRSSSNSDCSCQNILSPPGDNKFTSDSNTISPPPPPSSSGFLVTPLSPSPQLARRSMSMPSLVGAELSLESTERFAVSTHQKLKPLYWSKLCIGSQRMKTNSLEFTTETMENLFMLNAANTLPRDMAWRSPVSLLTQKNRIIEQKKIHNIEILLKALNITKEEVCDALLEGNMDNLSLELLETLLKMVPTKEEEQKLKDYNDEFQFELSPVEKFLKEMLDIPFAFERINALLYISKFDSEIKYLEHAFETLQVACKELKNGRTFLNLVDTVLSSGRQMNLDIHRNDTNSCKLDELLGFVNLRLSNCKTTLLNFVIQEIVRDKWIRETHNGSVADRSNYEEHIEFKKFGYQAVSRINYELNSELEKVKMVASIDSTIFNGHTENFGAGICKVREAMKLNDSIVSKSSGKFSLAMSEFISMGEKKIAEIEAQEKTALSLVKEATEHFLGNFRKEDQPLRIFTLINNFLSIFDRVCKEIGKSNQRTILTSGCHFPLLLDSPLSPAFQRCHTSITESSGKDESCYSL